MAGDARLAPELEHVELDGSFLAGHRVDDLHLLERDDHGRLRDLDDLACSRRPGLDHVRRRRRRCSRRGGRSRTSATRGRAASGRAWPVRAAASSGRRSARARASGRRGGRGACRAGPRRWRWVRTSGLLRFRDTAPQRLKMPHPVLIASGGRSSSARSGLVSPHRPRPDLVLALLLSPRLHVAAHLERRQLALQLDVALPPVGRERPVGERRLHRAVRLAVVAAVGEPAAGRDLLDVAERLRADRRPRAAARASRACRGSHRRPAAAPARGASSCGGRAGRTRAPPAWRSRRCRRTR